MVFPTVTSLRTPRNGPPCIPFFGEYAEIPSAIRTGHRVSARNDWIILDPCGGNMFFFGGRLKMSRNVESKHAILSLGDRNNENMAMYQSQIRASGLSK